MSGKRKTIHWLQVLLAVWSCLFPALAQADSSLPTGNFALETGATSDSHSTTQVTYDTLGRRSSVTDQEGNVTNFEYDDLGRLTAVIDAENNRTEYEYNEQGSLLVQRDAEGRETKFAYDSLGRRVKRTLPQGQVETITYNILGNMLTRNDFNGHTTSYAYDIMNRLTTITAAAGHPSLSLAHAPAKFEYGYDTLGRRNSSTVKDNGGNVLYERSWDFDSRGRNTLITSTNGNIGYSYNANSNLTGAKSSTTGGYDQSYDYDALNRMTTAYYGQEGVDPAAYGVASYGYDAVGNMTGSGYANGVGHQYNYSALNRLKDLTVGKMSSGVDPPTISTIHQKYTYTLNNAGHRTQIVEHGGRTINYVFDKLYRLKSEAITGDSNGENGTISYSHDKVGNRLSRTSSVSSVPTVANTFTDNDHLTGDTVDSNGNTIASPIAHLADHTGTYTDVYDFRNKLIKRSYTGGKIILLSYDADGNRVSKEVLDGSLGIREHHYLVDTNNHTGYAQVVEERDAVGSVTHVNLYGHDLVSTNFLTEGYQRYYQYDGLGSVRALSDENGDLTDEYTYDAFGLLLSSTGSTPNQYRYTGEQWDADLGMYFLRARYMNVATGRFHSMDSYEGRNGEPMTLHKYLYAHANPVSNIDPSGNFSVLTFLAPTVFLSGSSALRTFEFRLKISIATTIFKLIYIHRYIIPLIREMENAVRKFQAKGMPLQAAAAQFAVVELIEVYQKSLVTTGIGVLANQFGGLAGGTLLVGAIAQIYEGVETALSYTNLMTQNRFLFHVEYLKSAKSLILGQSRPDLLVFWSTELALSGGALKQENQFILSEIKSEYEKHGQVIDIGPVNRP